MSTVPAAVTAVQAAVGEVFVNTAPVCRATPHIAPLASKAMLKMFPPIAGAVTVHGAAGFLPFVTSAPLMVTPHITPVASNATLQILSPLGAPLGTGVQA